MQTGHLVVLAARVDNLGLLLKSWIMLELSWVFVQLLAVSDLQKCFIFILFWRQTATRLLRCIHSETWVPWCRLLMQVFIGGQVGSQVVPVAWMECGTKQGLIYSPLLKSLLRIIQNYAEYWIMANHSSDTIQYNRMIVGPILLIYNSSMNKELI